MSGVARKTEKDTNLKGNIYDLFWGTSWRLTSDSVKQTVKKWFKEKASLIDEIYVDENFPNFVEGNRTVV